VTGPGRTAIRACARSARCGLILLGIAWLAACRSDFGQPDRVVQGFYGAAVRGDAAAAAKYLLSRLVPQASEIVRTTTRDGTLQRAELASTDVWSEHGAVCEVRKTFTAGVTEVVRIEVSRDAGDWKVASGKPSF